MFLTTEATAPTLADSHTDVISTTAVFNVDQMVYVQGVPMHVVHWQALGPEYWEGSYCQRNRLTLMRMREIEEMVHRAMEMSGPDQVRARRRYLTEND